MSRVALMILLALSLAGCGNKTDSGSGNGTSTSTSGMSPSAMGTSAAGSTTMAGTSGAAPSTPTAAAQPTLPDSLPNGLLISYAQFIVRNGEVTSEPGPARLELLSRAGGEWNRRSVEDSESNVFHKAFMVDLGQGSRVVTLGGTTAAVKVWTSENEALTATTLWQKEWGGRFNRMRDAEVADLNKDGNLDIAIGTHDKGVFAVLWGKGNGEVSVQELDQTDNTFIHEIEIGDLNGDGTPEVYATPSEPNTLEGGEQHGEVVRYVGWGEGEAATKTVVADLGNRHAKEIYVGDVDGDGTDELYVAVEALTEGSGRDVRIAEPVEIRRYDADTPPDQGVVVATLRDRFTRFLTVGDVDGDGKKEMVAAAFTSGLWLLSPGRDPRSQWSKESIDRDSGGFEHSSVFADLDGDGSDELYVAADNQGELRRYVWVNGRARRETIFSRPNARAMMTWNLMPFSVADVP